MRIVDVKVTVVELSGTESLLEIVPVPDPHRLRFTHRRRAAPGTPHELFLRVLTDEGIEGVCTASSPGMPRERLELLKAQVIGADPLRREELYQKLHLGTRWVYQTPGWFGNFDNCLWDIAGKVAGLPVCRLLGQVRDRIPAYHTGRRRRRDAPSTTWPSSSGCAGSGGSRPTSSTTTRARRRTSPSSGGCAARRRRTTRC